MHRILFFCFLSTLFTGSSLAQQWTLQQCIDRALEHNIQIKQSSLNNELNKVQVSQNTASMLPSINGNASQNYFYGRSIDPFTNVFTTQEVRSNSFSLTGNLPLFEGFQMQNALKESKLTYLSSQNELKKVKNDISLSVVNFYLQVLYNDELLKVSNDQAAATSLQRDRMKRMFEVGAVNKGNYLDLESQLASDEVRQIQAQSALDQAVLSLTQLLELDTMKGFAVVRPDAVIPDFDSSIAGVNEIFQAALVTQPEIKSSEYKVLAAEKGLDVARGARYPRLYLSGSIGTNYSTSSKNVDYILNPPVPEFSGFTSGGDSVFLYVPSSTPVISDVPFKDQLDNNLGKSVGFTLQVPIFNGWSVRSNVARAKINLANTSLNHELTRKTLYKSVQQAVADASAAYKTFLASQRSVDALEETYNYNEQRLELGLINTFDYQVAKNNYTNALATLLQSKYDYIFRIKILDFYRGKPLTL